MGRHLNTNAGAQRGMVLLMTLAFLAVIAVAAGFFAVWVAAAAEEIAEEHRRIEAEISVVSTRNSLLYHIATTGLRPEGVQLPLAGEGAVVAKQMSVEDLVASLEFGQKFETGPSETVSVDDRGFSGIGLARFSIRDEAGLVGIDVESDGALLRRLLAACGIPESQQATLVDRLFDYVDGDELVRLNGAEADAYRRSGLAAPANAALMTSNELVRVLGWEPWMRLPDGRKLSDFITVGSTGGQNLNAMPDRVLQAVLGVSAAEAAAMLKVRNEKPFSSFADALARSGARLSVGAEGGFAPTPGSIFRFRFWSEGARRSQVYRIEFAPFSEAQQPWTLLSVTQEPLAESHAETQLTRLKSALFIDTH